MYRQRINRYTRLDIAIKHYKPTKQVRKPLTLVSSVWGPVQESPGNIRNTASLLINTSPPILAPGVLGRRIKSSRPVGAETQRVLSQCVTSGEVGKWGD